MVSRNLQAGSGDPDDKQQSDASPGENGAHAGGRPVDNGDGGSGFRQHHGTDDKRGAQLVNLLVVGESGTSDQGEHGVMYDLYKPDQTHHIEGGNQLQQEQGFQSGMVLRI